MKIRKDSYKIDLEKVGIEDENVEYRAQFGIVMLHRYSLLKKSVVLRNSN